MQEDTSGIAEIIDRISDRVGRAVSWLTLLMVLVTFVIVVLRYAFGSGFIWMQESLTWMHAVVFMLGAAWTLQQDEHVRVDIFYRDMSAKGQAWVNLLGVLIFMFPLCGFFLYQAYDYVIASWSVHEISRDTGGLPYPALPLLKSMLLLMPVAIALQALSMLLRSWRQIRER
jgi:TRAP-type mannitol/chloroaromatic compound transport system permease small subunit